MIVILIIYMLQRHKIYTLQLWIVQDKHLFGLYDIYVQMSLQQKMKKTKLGTFIY